MRRRLHDRIEDLVTKAIATHDPDELDAVMRKLREALHTHSERLRHLAWKKLSARPGGSSRSMPVV